MDVARFLPFTKAGVNLLTDGNEQCFIGQNKVESIRGNKREWTFGISVEMVGGKKTFVIHGVMTEVFVAAKSELFFQFEKKVNLGSEVHITNGKKTERTIAAHVEIDRGPKFHIGIAGQKRFINSDQFRALEDKQIIQNWQTKIGAEFETAATHAETFTTLVDEVNTDRLRAQSMVNRAEEAEISYKDCNIVCTTFKIDCSGALKFDPVGSIKVHGTKKLRVKGASIKLDGGGATFEMNGGLKANGQALTYG